MKSQLPFVTNQDTFRIILSATLGTSAVFALLPLIVFAGLRLGRMFPGHWSVHVTMQLPVQLLISVRNFNWMLESEDFIIE